MPSIKEKLAFFEKKTGLESEKGAFTPPADDGRLHLGLQTLQTEWGEALVREKQIFYHRYPALDLRAFLRLEPDDFCYIGKSWQYQSFDAKKILLIDTETTGLAGGTGTYVFLVGLARFQDDHVLIKQYYLLNQGMEYPFLQMILQEFQDVTGLLSFNGKSYDLPLLKTRLVLNRMPFPYEELPHLDLLHTARRLWKSLPGYSLSTLEEYVLRVRREGDVPGYLIPGVYFKALLTGDLRPLQPVLQHNVIDLLSMVGVAIEAARIFKEQGDRTAASLISVMRTLEALDLLQEATTVGDASPMTDAASEDVARLLLYRARYLKKLHRMDEAVQIWQAYIDKSMRFSAEPYVELAKHFEHGCRDFGQALTYIEKAESRLQILMELRDLEKAHSLLQDISKRKARLLRKMHKA
ncbi:ribonuclease H-like domain-containing protein [candidate division KSB1 bacterium]|nr:ribonuclease H-like domain-containing protein [candidate division KSB1 bacterium]